MLSPETLLDAAEETGLRLVDAADAGPSGSPLVHGCLLPPHCRSALGQPLLAACHADGSVTLCERGAGSPTPLERYEMHFQMVAAAVGSALPPPECITRRWATAAALPGDRAGEILFSVAHSNQVLLTSLPGFSSELLGSGTRQRQKGSFLHGSRVLSLGSHKRPITALSLDADGDVLVTGDAAGNLKLWPLTRVALRPAGAGASDTGDEEEWAVGGVASGEFAAHDGPVTALAHVARHPPAARAPSLRRVLSAGGAGGNVRVWGVGACGSVLGSLAAWPLAVLRCGAATVSSLAGSGATVAAGTGHGTLLLWDLDGQGMPAGSASAQQPRVVMAAEHADSVAAVAVHCDDAAGPGLCVAADGAGVARIYRPKKAAEHGGWGLVGECFLGSPLSLLALGVADGGGELVVCGGAPFGPGGPVLRAWSFNQLPTDSTALPVPPPPPPPTPPRSEPDPLNLPSAVPEPRLSAPPPPAAPSPLPPGAAARLETAARDREAAVAAKVAVAADAVARIAFGENDENTASNAAPKARGMPVNHVDGDGDGGGDGGDVDGFSVEIEDVQAREMGPLPTDVFRRPDQGQQDGRRASGAKAGAGTTDGPPPPPFATAALNSTAKTERVVRLVAGETFDPRGTKVSEEARRYAARVEPPVVLGRYEGLERLDPSLPDLSKGWLSSYKVDDRYATTQRLCGLSAGDFWLPEHLTALPDKLAHAFPPSAAGSDFATFDPLDAHAALVGFEIGAAAYSDYADW